MGNHNSDSGKPQENVDVAKPDTAVPTQDNETEIDEKCRNAVKQMEWSNIDKDEAGRACQKLHAHLISVYHAYENITFKVPKSKIKVYKKLLKKAGIEKFTIESLDVE